jgi:transcriptional regulator with XRE-family HTH domain
MCSQQFIIMIGTGIEQRFGIVVRQARRKLGLTQHELASRAGLHRTYISDVERGKRNVSLRIVERLAEALNVQVGTLFTESSDESNLVAMNSNQIASHRGTLVDRIN